jgi:hypothetical protein
VTDSFNTKLCFFTAFHKLQEPLSQYSVFVVKECVIEMKSRFFQIISSFFLIIILPSCQEAAQQSSLGWYQDRGAVSPRNDRIVICHAFGCARRTVYALSPSDKTKLKAFLKAGSASAIEERKAIAKAVMWFEKRVGPIVGSDKDIGGLDMQNAGVAGQMDCIDEATNTTSLLLILEENTFLKYHTVGSPVARGFFLDGRYPHATATLIETVNNQAYAIDPWPYGNGENVDVMPLQAWFNKRPSTS